jgi:hypothetical protein
MILQLIMQHRVLTAGLLIVVFIFVREWWKGRL